MSGRVSPFAALIGADRQIKWLEYQSICLPYVHGSVDTSMEAEPSGVAAAMQESACAAQAQPVAQATSAAKPSSKAAPAQREPPREQRTTQPILSTNDIQKIRHRQYDAVIARMKQAEMRADGFRTFS
ncbi:MAG: hypothetical protein RSC98_02430 [Clostridia bacterium]